MSETACGEPVALSVMVKDADSAPTACGEKISWTEHWAPAARYARQLFDTTKDVGFSPVSAILLITSALPPVLVRVTVCSSDSVPKG